MCVERECILGRSKVQKVCTVHLYYSKGFSLDDLAQNLSTECKIFLSKHYH